MRCPIHEERKGVPLHTCTKGKGTREKTSIVTHRARARSTLPIVCFQSKIYYSLLFTCLHSPISAASKEKNHTLISRALDVPAFCVCLGLTITERIYISSVPSTPGSTCSHDLRTMCAIFTYHVRSEGQYFTRKSIHSIHEQLSLEGVARERMVVLDLSCVCAEKKKQSGKGIEENSTYSRK